MKDWARRSSNGPVIKRLVRECDAAKREIVRNVFAKFNGKLTEEDKEYLEKAFGLLQNQILHGPIRALTEETHAGGSGRHTLLEALRKLFGMHD